MIRRPLRTTLTDTILPYTTLVRSVEQAEQVQNVQRIRRRQILDPKDEGLVPHLDGQHQHLIECEENRNLKEHGQTASQRIDLFLAIKLHHFLLKAGLVVLEFFLKCLHFRLYGAHCGHGGELLLRNGEHQQSDNERQNDRSEEHTSELQSLMSISYAVF